MKSLRPWNSRLTTAALLGGAWLVLVGLFAAQFVVAGALPWSDALVRAGAFWLPWLVFLPFAWFVAQGLLHRHVPWPVSLPVHALACAMVVAGCHLLMPALDPPLGAGRESPPASGSGAPPPPRGPEYGAGPPWPRAGGLGPPRPENGRPRGRFGPLGFRSIIDLVIYGGVVSCAYAVTFLRRAQQRERRALELEASLSRAKLEALRLQINPHFLFNTLNAVASLIHSRPDAADEMIGSLSQLLRASLRGAGRHEVPLGEELELLRLFTDIERTRFGDRFRFAEDIAPDTLAAWVPSLILQPLVENAIRHGLEPRTGPGKVLVQSRHAGNQLMLTVQDDGLGFVEKASSAGDGGIGLANTRDRLRALYHENQSLTIGPAPGGGSIVTVTVPWHSNAPVSA